uniref:Uncharacterized protein n=1 Tax=Panagrolaimus davidi TaxID=227884 RepID=A0A914PY66_9BILA
MKWIIKKEDVEKRVFLNVAAQYHLPQLPGVFLRFSIIKDRHDNDMIRFDVEVDKGPEKRIRTNLKIRVRSAKFEKCRIGEYIKKGFCVGNFTTKRDLLNPEKNFFVDGNLILDITGIISVDRPIITEIENLINFHYKTEIVNPFPEIDHCIYSFLVEEKRIKVGISMPQLEKIGDQPDIEGMTPQTSIFGCGLVTGNKKFL